MKAIYKTNKKPIVYRVTKQANATGLSCKFYKMNKRTGLKTFDNYDDALHAMKRQRLFYRKGVAPKVLSRKVCLCEYLNGSMRYGYLTELVKTVSQRKHDRDVHIIDDMCAKYNYLDGHAGNFGINKAGKYVFIDFCSESCWN